MSALVDTLVSEALALQPLLHTGKDSDLRLRELDRASARSRAGRPGLAWARYAAGEHTPRKLQTVKVAHAHTLQRSHTRACARAHTQSLAHAHTHTHTHYAALALTHKLTHT